MFDTAGALLVLPDGRVILNRRDSKAPVAPNTLSLFGGHRDGDETPEETVRRELKEETSLDVDSLKLTRLGQVKAVIHDNLTEHTEVFKVEVTSSDFEVYEGDGLEVYTMNELKQRTDLAGTMYAIFEQLEV